MLRLIATALAVALVAATPATASPPDPVDEAVERGVGWLRAQQDPLTGEIAGFGGDWSLGALAAAGVDAAAVRSGDGPSAQSFYLGHWTTGGDDPWQNWTAPSGAPDGRPATDYERALLHAHAGGLQVTRLSRRAEPARPARRALQRPAGHAGRPRQRPDRGHVR